MHLSGYGGFQVTNLAGYSAVLGRLWLAKGGTRVVANLDGIDPSDIEVGMAVEATFVDFDDDLSLPVFVPSGGRR